MHCKYCGVKLTGPTPNLPGFPPTELGPTDLAEVQDVGFKTHWVGCYSCFKQLPNWGPATPAKPVPINVSKEQLQTLLYDLGFKGISDSRQRKILDKFYEDHHL